MVEEPPQLPTVALANATSATEAAAAAGCANYQKELETGKKAPRFHSNHCLSRKRRSLEAIRGNISLKDTAAGCVKCQKELESGKRLTMRIPTTVSAGRDARLRRHSRTLCSRGCIKCQKELGINEGTNKAKLVSVKG